MNEKLWWYIARAGGVTAWTLVAASVLWGLMLSTRVMAGRVRPAWLLDLHRFLGGLSLIFTVVHVAGLVADSWLDFGWSDVFVPFASRWRPAAVAWGVIALYLLAAVEITSLLRRHLPHRWWRRVHATSLPLFLLSTLHGLTAGSEARSPGLRAGVVAVVAAFMFLLAYRALTMRPGRDAAA